MDIFSGHSGSFNDQARERKNAGTEAIAARYRLGANIAVIARRFEDAFAMLGDALALLGEPGPEGRDEGVYSLASYVYTRVGEIARAEELFASALPRLERADFESGLAEARLYLARLESARGNDARVEELLRASIRQFETEENWEYLAEAHRMLAGVVRSRGGLAQALDHYDAFMQAREQHLDMARARQLAFLEVEFDSRRPAPCLAVR